MLYFKDIQGYFGVRRAVLLAPPAMPALLFGSCPAITLADLEFPSAAGLENKIIGVKVGQEDVEQGDAVVAVEGEEESIIAQRRPTKPVHAPRRFKPGV